MFETAGIDKATLLLQPLDDVFVGILREKKTILKMCIFKGYYNIRLKKTVVRAVRKGTAMTL